MSQAELITSATKLVLTLTEQREREDRAFREGYQLGFRSAWEAGYAHANHEMDKAWAKVAADVRRAAGQVSHAELVRRRRG